MKSKTCCFTGHRLLPENQRDIIAARLEQAVVSLIRSGYLYFGAGGALGFDTVCAQTVLRLRKSYPAIKLILVLPCISQADRWSPADQAVYQGLVDKDEKRSRRLKIKRLLGANRLYKIRGGKPRSSFTILLRLNAVAERRQCSAALPNPRFRVLCRL